jgi:excisionase family DNA binding protein
MSVIHHTQPPTEATNWESADAIATKLSCTGRYILLLAAEGRIPCLRIGPKCVRFRFDDVLEALNKKGGGQ